MLGLTDTVTARRVAFGPPDGAPPSDSFEAPCPAGGSVLARIAGMQANELLSSDDRFVTVFRACRFERDGEVFSGSGEFMVRDHRFDGAIEVTELRFRFLGLGTDTLRWSGLANVALRIHGRSGAVQYAIEYLDLAVQSGIVACRWNFRLEVRRPPIGDRTASVDGAVTIGRLTLALAQDEPFVLARDATPRAGRLTATDPQAGRLQVEAATRSYRYRYFAQGNRGETPDATSQGR
jgi:YD repeat-containing protein